MGRMYHKAAKINDKGQASALCYKTPHAIPSSETWTLRAEAVTCPKCKALLIQMPLKSR